mmetsp:Transcript_63218/g.105203  ORF Transcript_63218/g.105203 Transcript_63218/m.105203 type:complete len:218 (+) Transcript_63218:86-739(+)
MRPSFSALLFVALMPLASCLLLAPNAVVLRRSMAVPAMATGGPVDVLRRIPALSGPVANGFGRGSRKLGFPTANLPCSLFQDSLEELETGVYVGWASLRGDVHKCVVNVGFAPSFEGQENPEMTVEAVILDSEGSVADVGGDFYGETMRLMLLGFVREERKFDFSNGPGPLIAAITNDAATAAAALDTPQLKAFRAAKWLSLEGGEPAFVQFNPTFL